MPLSETVGEGIISAAISGGSFHSLPGLQLQVTDPGSEERGSPFFIDFGDFLKYLAKAPPPLDPRMTALWLVALKLQQGTKTEIVGITWNGEYMTADLCFRHFVSKKWYFKVRSCE